MPITDLFANGNLPNILLIITDQERRMRHWPSSFLANLPAMQQLMNTGLTFNQAFTGACMCSPSRATFLTSNYPAVTRLTNTMSPEPNPPLNPAFPNLAAVLAKAGYQTIGWRGKWHLGNTPNDYGFSGWVGPDAGTYLDVINSALGDRNDPRFLGEVLEFLGDAANTSKPFCLVASFVNPHDVFLGQMNLATSGYIPLNFTEYSVPVPLNSNETLATKPRIQANMSWSNLQPVNSMQDYVNFYAYLQVLVDEQILQILQTLQFQSLIDNTLVIRIADHGEMGLSHSLVEKFYNAYEETINIPLIFSNPVACPTAQATDSIVSLVDLVPTLASLLGVSGDFTGFKGQDLTPILANPTATVQESVHFTYDDDVPSTAVPGIIRTIRAIGYAYSVYFVADGTDADWELYDLAADPLENNNVAGTQAYGTIQQQLDSQLQAMMTANGTMPTQFQWPPQRTANSRGGPPAPGA